MGRQELNRTKKYGQQREGGHERGTRGILSVH